MGCCMSAPPSTSKNATSHKAEKLSFGQNWSLDGMTREELEIKRAEFWDTQPSYGGSPEVWSVLKSIFTENRDIDTAKTFLDAAEVKIAKPDLTAFYDSRGFLYELPNYAVAEPVS